MFCIDTSCVFVDILAGTEVIKRYSCSRGSMIYKAHSIFHCC